jgi:TfoX/Sxy family transcriptional regulator of competence genes
MGKETAATAPADKVVLYDQLVATNPAVQRKGATMPYTSLNGHMFSYLTPSGILALRLPPEEREEFLKKYKTRLCEQHGIIQKEYVEVPDGLLKKTQELKKYFDQSYAYVASLKPKATKRKTPKSRKS